MHISLETEDQQINLPCRVEENQNTATILFCMEKQNSYIL